MRQEGRAEPEEVLRIFDHLPAVPESFLWGQWKGSEITTGHPLDGLLGPTGWYGKRFDSREQVHPLLFYTPGRRQLYAVDPRWIPLQLNFPRSRILGGIMALARPFLQTRRSRARLRMLEYRGKITATMCYDHKPIFDHFARIDEHCVLGLMDMKLESAPYAFLLERDDANTLHTRL